MPNNLATKFVTHFTSNPPTDAIAFARYLNFLDPQGIGRLNKEANAIEFRFTDGSKALIDMTNRHSPTFRLWS